MHLEPSRSALVARLRELASGESVRTRGDTLPFELSAIDGRMATGGLDRSALHEVAPASTSLADEAAATLFLAGLGGRLAASGGTVLWVVTRFDLYAPGLAQAGLRADCLLYAQGRDEAECLALAEDGLRHGSLAAVIVEVKRAPMVAARRLQLAAQAGGTPALLLRRWTKSDRCSLAEPSAAATRWRVGSAPSAPLPYRGVGRGRWRVELVRQRNGAPMSLIVDACDDTGRLGLPAATADRASAARDGIGRAA